MASRRVLDGIVPVLRQTPPIMSLRSTIAARRPSFAVAIAAFWPLGPEPMTSTSKSYIVTSVTTSAGLLKPTQQGLSILVADREEMPMTPVMPGRDVHAELAGRPALLQEASERALAYLDGLAGRPVAPAADAVAALRRLDFALSGSGMDPGAVLALLDEAGSPATVASAGPRYFGFVTGGALPIAQAAAWLSIAWDQNVALTVMSPAAATLNSVALR